MKKAIVLLSGGLDSSTILAIAKDKGFLVNALTIFYGQRHNIELECAKKVAAFFNVAEHRFLDIDLHSWRGSSLTDKNLAIVPHKKSFEIPNTYVPARNTILLSLALAYAEISAADDIFFGATAQDYSGYPDCRPEYVKAFQTMANLSTVRTLAGFNMNIHTPLMHLKKSEIITLGISLGVDYSLTHSCYAPTGELACGECSSCFFRHKGFVEAKVDDPTRYVDQVYKNGLITSSPVI